ncbi:MAG: hypothetical protein JXR61_12340 [Prolixibacteraceae bacterium]|nr:hypothetical protein [Prolixibacteraceae bacterium]
MYNIGLIGNTEFLEPFVKRIKKNKLVNIIGKASVGSSSQLNSFHYTIPEFNKVELIERSDIFLIDNTLAMPFKILSEIIKKSKHVFAAGYPNLTIEECTQLVKFANESGSVFQVNNPYYFSPAIQWLSKNGTTPVFMDIIDFTGNTGKEDKLYPIVMMLLGLTGNSPKKVGAVTFNATPEHADFTNVRLEFGDASVVNISYGKMDSLEEFKIRAYSKNQFVRFNFSKKTFVCNNEPLKLTDYPINEFDSFINAINKTAKKQSSLEDYLIAMYLVQKINKKIAQFFTQ